MSSLAFPELPRDAAPRFPFPGYPKGWFAVAFSDEIAPGAVVRLRYFGRDLVAFRGESGRVSVTGAYCPHLGAHLGHGGVVEGDTIRCPFHGWRFDGQGRCASIPYSAHVPPKTGLEAFPVLEQWGVVLVFFDPTGGAPWELPTLDTEGWTPGRTIVWRGLRTHPQEIFENTVDTAHIGPVHAGRGARLGGPPKREGERMHVDVAFDAPGDVVGMPGTVNDVHLAVTMVGLGWVRVETHVRNVDVRARQRILVTPVDEETVDIRGIVHVRETDDPAFTAELARIFYEAYVEDFAKDFPIWENKRYLTRPRLAKGDGPIGTYRKWCEQFYVGAEPAPAERTADVSLAALRDSAARALAPLSRRLRALVSSMPRAERTEGAGGKGPSATEVRADEAPAPPPLRVASAREYRETLSRRFVPGAAAGVEAVFQWELAGEGGEIFHAEVKGGRLEVREGPHPRPTVTLRMAAEDYVRVVNGELDGMAAFTTGRGKVGGSLTMAMKMRSLFPA
ncbi:MAG: Rieske 2Fe-2S domain-containing protein [Sandaracinaceae bacterium]|nr:Rieske 2Fe-2S domain-containing protein [Sandaracinaceae bacterium]